MADQQTYTDAPLTPEQLKAVGYTDAPLSTHPEARIGADPDTGIPGMITQAWRRAFPPERPRLDSDLVTIGGVNIAPEDVLMVGQAGRAVAGAARGAAGAVPGIYEGAREAISQAAPAVKYEATKTFLEHLGVPSSLATVTAIAVSGYRRGSKTPPVSVPEAPASRPTTVSDVAPPGIDRYMPNVSGIEPIVPVSGQMKLTGPEFAAFQRSLKSGRSLPEALADVQAQRVSSAPSPVLAGDRRIAGGGLPPGISERRMAELQQKFGGTQGGAASEQQAVAAPVGAALPVAVPVAPAAPMSPRGVTPSALPAETQAILQALVKEGLTETEALQTVDWMRQGVRPQTAYQRIRAIRAARGGTALGNLPTDAEVAAEIAARKGNRSPRR